MQLKESAEMNTHQNWNRPGLGCNQGGSEHWTGNLIGTQSHITSFIGFKTLVT